jgi:hypothetical protein
MPVEYEEEFEQPELDDDELFDEEDDEILSINTLT